VLFDSENRAKRRREVFPDDCEKVEFGNEKKIK